MQQRSARARNAPVSATAPAQPAVVVRDEAAMQDDEDPRGLLVDHGRSKSAFVHEDESKAKMLDRGVMLFILAIAASLRFYLIWHPAAVVFDEVHFGKFASYYLRREYFFDVHPPLAKLLLAFAGWAIGYDGHYEFDNIGEDYVAHDVPYIGLRALPAIFGSLTPVLAYATMRETGFPRLIGILAAMLIAIDNGHVVQTRLILLDAPLIFFLACSIYAYIRFHKLRYQAFTTAWWTWMLATGVSLALTISCKMVGLFAFLTIGTAVLIDLWNILDIKRGHSLDYVAQHFFARAFGLILVPAVVYLFWFWVHFTILTHSGPGDEFMSARFQQTLENSPLTLQAQEIHYYDTLIITHKTTKAQLHSHSDRYPLRYDDGRISSEGQQVTAYPFNDTNNHWLVEPTRELVDGATVVKHHDKIRLVHVNSDSYLLSHDVASPLMPTNTEFTVFPRSDAEVADVNGTRYADTTFELQILDAHPGQAWLSKSSHFKLIHVPTKTAMWTHNDVHLPDWGFKQQEVNGNKNAADKTNLWFVDELIHDNTTDVVREPPKPREIKKLNFFVKFGELQILMLQHNAGLTDSHPYASGPFNWPFLISGISFWTGANESREQIYMIGNIASWWLCVIGMSVIVGVFGADQLANRRGVQPIPQHVRDRMYNTVGFFLMAWGYHYAPFFTMNRQLFLHHYLPAHYLSCLVAAGAFHFIGSETINYPISIPGPNMRRRPRQVAEVSQGMRIAAVIFLALIVAGFAFLAPLTYGQPGLSPEGVHRRRVLDSWTLHFAPPPH